MGLIRPNYLKNICEEIYRLYPDRVSKDFQLNKILVDEVTDVASKSIRNKIAGYLVVLKGKEGRLILAPKKQRKARNKKERLKLKKQTGNWIG